MGTVSVSIDERDRQLIVRSLRYLGDGVDQAAADHGPTATLGGNYHRYPNVVFGCRWTSDQLRELADRLDPPKGAKK